MSRGDVSAATAGESDDIFVVETEMYDTPEYGSVYVIASDRPALVDTGIGVGSEAILDALAELGIAPRDLAVIAPTHVHLDHAGGAGFLADACPNADVYVHERGARHLVDPSRLWAGTRAAVGDQMQFYAEPRPVPESRIVELVDGDEIDVGDRRLSVHDAPGHAPHQAVFFDPKSDGVFAADAAGIYTPELDEPFPTTPPPDFDLEQALADVVLLCDLDPTAIYYGHYGDSPADGLLSAYARVLEDWVGAIEAVRSDRGDDDAVVEHFVGREGQAAEAWGERHARAQTRMNVRGVLRYLDST